MTAFSTARPDLDAVLSRTAARSITPSALRPPILAALDGLAADAAGIAEDLAQEAADRAAAVDAEETARADADTALGVRIDAVLDLKADLESPELIGTPTAPTQSAGDNTTRIATTAFVQAAVVALVDTAPSTLDTLNELAAALGDDANFATTVTNALAGKVATGGALGTPSSGTLTNCTGLPTAGVSGLDSALAGKVATGGALGTPSSGTLTNCTGLPTAGVSGLGSAATQNTGTSGASVPLLNGANVWSGQQSVSLATLTDAANIAWDVAAKQKASVTLGGNRTMGAVSNAVAGTTYLLWVIQDGTGSRTLSWTTSGAGAFDFGADGAPTLTTTASKADLMVFEAISIGGTLKLRYAGIKKGFA